jgi:hypothetical protein
MNFKFYPWTVSNDGAYSIKHTYSVSLPLAQPLTADSGIEAKLERGEFAEARTVIDFIKSL